MNTNRHINDCSSFAMVLNLLNINHNRSLSPVKVYFKSIRLKLLNIFEYSLLKCYYDFYWNISILRSKIENTDREL
jgi:hypothetical protein